MPQLIQAEVEKEQLEAEIRAEVAADMQVGALIHWTAVEACGHKGRCVWYWPADLAVAWQLGVSVCWALGMLLQAACACPRR